MFSPMKIFGKKLHFILVINVHNFQKIFETLNIVLTNCLKRICNTSLVISSHFKDRETQRVTQ